ncbi:MAG TPA: hypothetical protein VHM90_21825 [Phycisphaerae bacterium]|nr:hypothetical protein [Phycisphaerae bacterium]
MRRFPIPDPRNVRPWRSIQESSLPANSSPLRAAPIFLAAALCLSIVTLRGNAHSPSGKLTRLGALALFATLLAFSCL